MGLSNHLTNGGVTKITIDGVVHEQDWECFDEKKEILITPIEMKYHTSWDWLMPVVERINTTPSDNYGNHYSFQIGNGFVWVDPHMGSRIFFSGNDIDHKDEPMISKVYRGVVEFIKQHNDEE